MKVKSALFFVLSLVVVSCNNKIKTNDSEDSTKPIVVDGHNAQNALDYIGIYYGTMPCADCEGIETTLELVDDKNYKLKTVYLGKKQPAEFNSEGTYAWNESGNSITLSGIKDAPSQFFVAENALIQLDMEGNRIKGDLADLYRLNKQEENSALSILKTKWKLVELNGKPIVKSKEMNKESFLQLNSENRYAAFAGCNNLMGEYDLKEQILQIKFSKGASTMMACSDMETEQEFGKMLETVDNYSINGNQMTLNKARMAPLAKFEAIN